MKPAQNPLVARIDAALAKAGETRRSAALRANLSPEFIRKIEERGPHASAGIRNLEKLAAAIGVPIDEILPTEIQEPTSQFGPASPRIYDRIRTGATVPILGTANGSAIGAFMLSNDPIGYAARPPGLQAVRDPYALYVRSESMEPRFRQGELVFVNPHKPPRVGDDVIVQVEKSQNEIEAYIKTLARMPGEWLTVRQLNPPAELQFKPSTIRAVHLVMTTNDLFNV